MKIQSWLPIFSGFNNTLFECDCEEDYIEEGKSYDDYTWDYVEQRERIAKSCVVAVQKAIKDNLDIDLAISYEKIVYPKGWVSESINVTFELTDEIYSQIVKMLEVNYADALKQFCIDNYTSYDGFSSFYPNDSTIFMKEYIKPKKKVGHVFGAILSCMLLDDGYNVDDLYEEVSEEVQYIQYELI